MCCRDDPGTLGPRFGVLFTDGCFSLLDSSGVFIIFGSECKEQCGVKICRFGVYVISVENNVIFDYFLSF